MRKLAAIMFTDMVGYSALAQKNEALALDLLDEHRKILRPLFTRHEGREIDTAGDSFFVEFNSAVEATNCAVEIQTVLHERNKTEVEERRILLRIGLHIGDVVYVGDNVHGDGVNIAARMEPLATPGGICISEDVARQIRNKIDHPVIKLGPGKLKNISMPMEIYCIELPWLKTTKLKKTSWPRKKILPYLVPAVVLVAALALFFFAKDRSSEPTAESKQRVAVLPLANISNDPKDDYFADGMTEELISSLSKISGLNVIARTSVMKYKTGDKDISQIGKELMVGSILEGSVRKVNDRARINVQLINVSNQEPVWSTEYDRELKDIFMTQSEIAQKVANELKVRLVSSEKEQLQKAGTENMAAYQEYLIGRYFLNQKTPESIQAALVHFESANKEDSTFALPYSNVAYCYTLIGVAGYGNISRDTAEIKAKQAVMKALQIDGSLAEAHAALAYIKFRFDWDWKGAEDEFKKAIALKPGYSTAHEWYALFLAVQARLDEALKQMQTAYQLDPLSTSVNNGLARIYHFRNENEKVIAQVNKTLTLDSNYAEAYFTQGINYFKLGEYEKAEPELKKAIDLSNRRPVIVGLLGCVYAKEGKTQEANKLLTELETGAKNNDNLYAAALIQLSMGQQQQALTVLNKLINEKYGIMIYLKVEGEFFLGIDKTTYARLLKEIGFE